MQIILIVCSMLDDLQCAACCSVKVRGYFLFATNRTQFLCDSYCQSDLVNGLFRVFKSGEALSHGLITLVYALDLFPTLERGPEYRPITRSS